MKLVFLPYVAAAAASGVGGGLLATVWRPGRCVTSYIQHFAAGVVIAAVALKVAPDLERTHARLAVTSGISLLLLGGAWAGMLLLRGASVDTLAAVLSFGAAALLSLVTEELLVETRLPEETLLSTAMFFLGFLAILASVALGPAWGR